MALISLRWRYLNDKQVKFQLVAQVKLLEAYQKCRRHEKYRLCNTERHLITARPRRIIDADG